jgi:hypothetical protein
VGHNIEPNLPHWASGGVVSYLGMGKGRRNLRLDRFVTLLIMVAGHLRMRVRKGRHCGR